MSPQKKWRGTYTVLVTPFTADGLAVDVPGLKRLVDWQIEQGIHGLIPLGSTGEFLSMTMAEQEMVMEVCIKQAAGRVPVLIGTGAEWTDEAVMKARLAESLGADGVMVIPPYYSTPTPDELFEHYRKIGEAVSFPIMIYNNPATANVDLTPEIVARLARIDNVRYIKESTLEVTRVRDIIELCGDKMTVFAGILGYESFWLGGCVLELPATRLSPPFRVGGRPQGSGQRAGPLPAHAPAGQDGRWPPLCGRQQSCPRLHGLAGGHPTRAQTAATGRGHRRTQGPSGPTAAKKFDSPPLIVIPCFI